MLNFEYITIEYIKEHNPNWLKFLTTHTEYSYLEVLPLEKQMHYLMMNQILIVFLYAKDPYEVEYQLLINKRESTGLKYLNDSKAFIEYSNEMDDIKILKCTIQIKNRKY